MRKYSIPLAVAIIALIIALPAVPSLLGTEAEQHETSDSPNGRVLAAVYDLNTTDYSFRTFRPERSSGERLDPVSVIKIENSGREAYVVTPSGVPSNYQHRSLVWGYNSLRSQWEFTTTISYCERRTPFMPHVLRTADRTVINTSETNTTVRYERRVARINLDVQVLNTTVSLDAQDRIDTVVQRYRVPANDEDEVARRIVQFGDYGNTTVDKPSLPVSLEAEILKRLAIVSGTSRGC